MKWTTDSLARVVEEDDPVPAIWDALREIWFQPAESVQSHYKREPEARNYERLLYDTYTEFFTDVLPERCVNEASLTVPDDGVLIVMDGMSVREAPLFVDVLDGIGYETDVGHAFSTVPSETEPFRERVEYNEMKREYKTTHVKKPDPHLDGDERIIWCRFPDALTEKIQEGKTQLSSVEEAYKKTETALHSIIDQLDPDYAVIRSDHGYVRLDSGHTFEDSTRYKDRFKEVFSSRYASVAEADGSDLVEENVVVEADGYYLPVGRYTWPTRGKYGTFDHGGLSLLECITPRITVTR